MLADGRGRENGRDVDGGGRESWGYRGVDVKGKDGDSCVGVR